MPGFDNVAVWIESIDEVPDTAYREVGLAGLDADVRAGSQLWCDDHLTPDASPYVNGRKVRTLAHGSTETETSVTIDLVRHQYEIGDLPVEVVEGRNFTLIRLTAPKVLQGTAAARGAEIHRLARLLLSQPWTFQLPPAIEVGARFSSAPDRNQDSMGSWKDRGDGGIRNGKLWFLCFRRIPDIMGYWNDCQWFPDDFRAKLK